MQGVNSRPPPDVLAAVPRLVQNAAVSVSSPVAPTPSVSAALTPLSAGPLASLDLQYLAQVINMQAVHTLVDPIGCNLAQFLAQLSTLVQSQRKHLAATAPVYGSSLRRASTTPQLVTSGSLGDMALVAVQPPVSLSGLQHLAASAPCVCIKLPGVLHTLPLDIQHWLHQLQVQRRLQVIVGYSQPSVLVPATHMGVWVCVFSSTAVRNALVLPHQQSSTSLAVVTW